MAIQVLRTEPYTSIAESKWLIGLGYTILLILFTPIPHVVTKLHRKVVVRTTPIKKLTANFINENQHNSVTDVHYYESTH